MARLSIAFLGPLQVIRAGCVVHEFGYAKVRALLAYLAVEHDRPHSRETLAELFWPEQPSGVGRADLRRALSTLRRALGDDTAEPRCLLVQREMLQFNLHPDCSVDVARFLDLMRACAAHTHDQLLCPACVERLKQATALYRGDFLVSLSLPENVAFEEWALILRERLHNEAIEALARLTRHYETVGLTAAAREAARRWALLARWDEEPHRCLMRLYAQAGQRSAALAQYQYCRRILAEELQLEPTPDTSALADMIRTGRISGTAQPFPYPFAHWTPPLAVTPLIGREQELSELTALFATAQQRLVTLCGPPGVGKTRLALAAATELLNIGIFPDGIWFIELAAISDPALVGPAMLRALALPERLDQTPDRQLAAFFSSRQSCLVLDNIEQLLDAVPLLRDLLTSAPGLSLLTTSRIPLRIAAEYEFAVRPLALPAQHHAHPDAIAQSAAIRLFVERARTAERNFTLNGKNAAAVAAICRRLDGLPLAIEMAAARIRLFTPAELLQRLEQSGMALLSGTRSLPARQQTLHNAIAWSYRLLTAAEQGLFRRLGIFVGDWALAAAEALWDSRGVAGTSRSRAVHAPEGPDSSPPAAMLLESLVDQSLVQINHDGPAPPRFRLLELIRSFALEQLEQQGELEQAHAHHALYYAALGDALEAGIYDTRQMETLDLLEREQQNFLAAVNWCLDQQSETRNPKPGAPTDAGSETGAPAAFPYGETALRLGRGLFWYWMLRGRQQEGRAWLARIMAAVPPEPTIAYARILGAAGSLAALNNDLEQAEYWLSEELELCRMLDHGPGHYNAVWMLSLIAWLQGDAARATEFADACMHLGPQLGAYYHAMALFQAGRVAATSDPVRGTPLLEAALEHIQNIGATWWAADILDNLGLAATFGGTLAQARTYFRRALEIGRSIRGPEVISSALVNLADIARLEGRYDEAAELLGESIRLHEELGEQAYAALFQTMQAQIAHERGNDAEAEAICRECLAIGQHLNHPGVLAGAWRVLGLLHLAHRDPAALECATAALEAARRYSDRSTLIDTLSLCARASSMCGAAAAARAYLNEQRALVGHLQLQLEQANLHEDDAIVALAMGDHTATHAHADAALAIYRRIGAYAAATHLLIERTQEPGT